MYDFDEDLPCSSPLLGDEFINTPTKVLRALDNNYNGQPILPYDNNIISYLRCKMGKKIEGILVDLNSNQPAMQISAVIRLYTSMQNKYGPANLTKLSKWLTAASKPLIESYHNLRLQKALEKEILKLSKSGKIADIHNLLEDETLKKEDTDNYKKAIKDVKTLIIEKHKILTNKDKLNDDTKDIAIRFAALIAILTMIISFIFNLIHWVIL